MLRVGSHPSLSAELPAAEDLATLARGRELLLLIGVQGQLARATAGPPGIPPGRLATLRRLYTKVMDDPAFRAAAHNEASCAIGCPQTFARAHDSLDALASLVDLITSPSCWV